MSRGRPTTTKRGRRAGAREARAWLSADEYAALQTAARRAGAASVPAFVRAVLIHVVAIQPKESGDAVATE